ncbi:MAG TPA: Lrp/AsnC family transcriptional regulator [Ardenticatenaceae bacterium]|nr:Lrp/AsnC family transcriptional regulator [Ardenticatenaceae bacterium]
MPHPVIDETDQTIMRALQEDGRRPFTEVAAMAGVSEGTVRNRVARLTDEGVLRVVGIADPYRIGYNAPAIVGVEVEPRYVESSAEAIASFEEVSYLVLTAGSFDFLVEVFTRDNEHFTRFLTQQLHQVEGVRRTETFFILRSYKLAFRWGIV